MADTVNQQVVLCVLFLDLFFAMILVAASGDAVLAGSEGQKKARHNAEISCLAQNIYFEARGEPMVGKIAVGHVVLNRAADRRWPRRACSVIKQGGYKQRHRCQFSWWCDGRSDRPVNRAAWKESQHLIKQGIANDPTNGALCYHAVNVRLVCTK